MALCTLAEVKEYNDITVTTNDTLLTNLISRVSTEIETYCDCTFSSASYTDYHDGNGDDKLYTDHYPIITGSGVEVWDDTEWDWETADLIDSNDYMIVNDRGIFLKSSIFVDGVKNVKISYTAGYDTIPTDLTQFTIEEVIRRFKMRKHPGDISSKALPDGTVTYKEMNGLPTDMPMLNSYKRIYIV